jgi:hypothetical protein
MMPTSKPIGIVNTSKNALVGSDIRVAATAWSRLVGLLGQVSLDPGGGLLIVPSSGVHTWGMLFPIDVVALDRRMRVLGVWERLGGFRIAAVGWRHAVFSSCRLGPSGAVGSKPTAPAAVIAPVDWRLGTTSKCAGFPGWPTTIVRGAASRPEIRARERLARQPYVEHTSYRTPIREARRNLSGHSVPGSGNH